MYAQASSNWYCLRHQRSRRIRSFLDEHLLSVRRMQTKSRRDLRVARFVWMEHYIETIHYSNPKPLAATHKMCPSSQACRTLIHFNFLWMLQATQFSFTFSSSFHKRSASALSCQSDHSTSLSHTRDVITSLWCHSPVDDGEFGNPEMFSLNDDFRLVVFDGIPRQTLVSPLLKARQTFQVVAAKYDDVKCGK